MLEDTMHEPIGDQFPRRQVGRTGLTVPLLGLGTAPFSRDVTEATAVETIGYALEAGARFIDTAPLYGAGLAERFVGKALQGVPRDSYVLATKIGRVLPEEPGGAIGFDYSRDGVLRSIEESLNRLGLDRIDILHIHDPDDHYREALEHAYPTLAELRSQGVIGAVGAGMNQWQMEADFARAADFNCFLLAGRYTILEQTSLDEYLPLCQEKGIGVFLGGVYNSGILATGAQPGATYNYAAAPPAIRERVDGIAAICTRHGVSLQTAAARFPLAHPAVTALLIGAQSPAEYAETIAALRTPIPAALWADLKAEGLLHPDAPVPTA
jgi:D-threo-aldose 1-dehydrogenase